MTHSILLVSRFLQSVALCMDQEMAWILLSLVNKMTKLVKL